MGFFSNSFFLVYKCESSSSSMSHEVLKTQRRRRLQALEGRPVL